MSKKSTADELIKKSNASDAVEEINSYFSKIGKELAEKTTEYRKHYI